MLDLESLPGRNLQPMTAMVEHGRSPIWFFTARDTALAGRPSAPLSSRYRTV